MRRMARILALAVVGLTAQWSLSPKAAAKEELTDIQLTEAGAGGLTIEATDLDLEQFTEDQIRRSVINNVFGDSSVTTEIFIEIGSTADEFFRQEIVIVQERGPSGDGDKKESVDERSLRIDSQKDLAKLVVNNVAGSSAVETVVNIYVPGIGQSAGAGFGVQLTQDKNSVGDTGSPTQSSSGGITVIDAPSGFAVNPPTSGAAGLAGASQSSQLNNFNTGNPFPLNNPPTTLSGTASFLETLTPLNPGIAPHIETIRQVDQFISTLRP